MKWFQLIKNDNTVKNPLVCGFSNLEEYGFEDWDFNQGKFIDTWDGNIYFKAKKKEDEGVPDDVLQVGYSIPVYSERLVKCIENEKISGIQFLKVKVLKSDNTEIKENFYIANVLNYIEALDYEKSIYNCFAEDFPNPNVTGKIAGVIKFVLKKNKLFDLDIIRLKEYQLSVFTSEKFKKMFEINNFTGYSFRNIQLR